MTKDELENAKLEAEIAKLHAETLESQQRRRWSGFSDAVKIVGGTLAVIIGFWAAATTYQIAQLQARLASIDKREAEKERAAAVRARDLSVAARVRAEAEAKAVERSLAEAQSKIEGARAELRILEAKRTSPEWDAYFRRIGGSLSAAAQSTARAIPYVLIVPATEAQETHANRMATQLSTDGFGASVFAHLKDVRLAPSNTEIRYFRPEDADEAKRLVHAVVNAGIPLRSVQLMYVAEPEGRRRRSFEVRFSANLLK